MGNSGKYCFNYYTLKLYYNYHNSILNYLKVTSSVCLTFYLRDFLNFFFMEQNTHGKVADALTRPQY